MSIRYRIEQAIRKAEKPFVSHNLITVSGEALRHNLALYRQLSGLAVIPVLKGNAYGHGIELVARALAGQRMPYIAVDGYFEALKVAHLTRQPVLVMGAIAHENFGRIDFRRKAFVVQHPDTVRALGRTGKKIKVHLEVNTGMNRYGVAAASVADLTRLILSFRNLELEGVMSHLADSDGDDPATVEAAVRAFDEAVETVRSQGADPKWIHVAQTAGSRTARSRYANAMRLGIGLYGVDPFPAGSPHALPDLRPALRLTTTITNVIDLQAGDKVSYNYTFTAPKAMRLGVVPLGYHEGIDRRLSNAGCMQYDGQYLPVVGRVCMNHTMIDLTGCRAQLGDQVTVISDRPFDDNSVATIASTHGLFSYSLLTGLSPDVRRVLAA